MELRSKLNVSRSDLGRLSTFPGDVRHASVHDVYDRDFKDNHDLISNIDWPSPTPYKSGDEIQIAGHVAIVNDGVQWASTLHGDAHGHGLGAEAHTPIDFLEEVAASPSKRVCVACISQLDGDESFCPNCGRDLR